MFNKRTTFPYEPSFKITNRENQTEKTKERKTNREKQRDKNKNPNKMGNLENKLVCSHFKNSPTYQLFWKMIFSLCFFY
jgi:hypothetical protein